MTLGAVELHAIEARRREIASRGDEQADHLLDLGRAERMGNAAAAWAGNRGGPDQVSRDRRRRVLPAAVVQLADQEAPPFVDCLRQRAQARDACLAKGRDPERPVHGRRVYAQGVRHDRADAASGDPGVVRDHALTDRVRLGEVSTRGRSHDAVARNAGPDRQRLEETRVVRAGVPVLRVSHRRRALAMVKIAH